MTSKFRAVTAKLTFAIDSEINECENQIKTIIKEIEKGETSIAKKRKTLDECESAIKIIGMEVDKLTFGLD